MLDHATHARWDRLPEVLAEDFEIAEPNSLPYGGTHRGVPAYVALMRRIGELFELAFDPEAVHAVDEHTVLLRMDVTFTARATARTVRLPVIEIFTVDNELVVRSEVFVSDTAALLATIQTGTTPT